MNYKDIYKSVVERVYNDHDQDIENTLIYIYKNQEELYRNNPDFREAKRALSSDERRTIIWYIITPF